MAIEIKTIDGWKAAAACGVAEDAIKALQEHGVTVVVQPSKVSLMKGKETLSAFMCKSVIIADAANGVIQPNAGLQAAFKNTAAMALTTIANGSPAPGPDILVKDEPSNSLEDAVKSFDFSKLTKAGSEQTLGEFAAKPSVLDLLVKKGQSVTEDAPTQGIVHTETFPISQMLTMETIPLAQATKLYQPVDGSSGGSRYFVVAMRSDLKVAARYLKTGKMSVRVEGPGLAKYEQALDAAGFSGGKAYRSLHVVPGQDLVMAGRTLGSILMGMNIDFTTVTPKIGVIAGKGH